MAKSTHHGKTSRFTDLSDEPVDHSLHAIKGIQDKSLLPLIEAIQPISKFFQQLEDYVHLALQNCQKPADGLTQEESASIHLYTMEWEDSDDSLYAVLNRTLRTPERQMIKPWFKYLKLFLTALFKLP